MTGRRRGSDPVRVVAAGLGGTAERCVVFGRLTEAEALADIRDSLAVLPLDRRQAALDFAAAAYVDPSPIRPRAADVAALLATAGANLDRARAIHAAPGVRSLTMVERATERADERSDPARPLDP